jgi:hypothetical protein
VEHFPAQPPPEVTDADLSPSERVTLPEPLPLATTATGTPLVKTPLATYVSTTLAILQTEIAFNLQFVNPSKVEQTDVVLKTLPLAPPAPITTWIALAPILVSTLPAFQVLVASTLS